MAWRKGQRKEVRRHALSDVKKLVVALVLPFGVMEDVISQGPEQLSNLLNGRA